LKATPTTLIKYLAPTLMSLGLVSTAFAAPPETGGRPTTMAPQAMVVTPHYLASQSALRILRNGGTALDAAIAAGATLAVVYPQFTAIGGDNVWLVYNAKNGEVRAMNAIGPASEKASIDFYKSKGMESIPKRGYLSAITVPGAVSGWDQAYAYSKTQLGSKTKWSAVLEDAIRYAQDGFPVSISHAKWAKNATSGVNKDTQNLHELPSFKATFMKPDGGLYEVGELFRQPELAKTLQRISAKGGREFYEGETAKLIVADMQAQGGLLTSNDLKSFNAKWEKPLSVEYRGTTAYNAPPPTQGMGSLGILNVLNNFDVGSLKEGSAEYVHLLVEATKQSFADRDRYLTDPDFNKGMPLEFVLSKQHGKDQAARIDMNKAADGVTTMDPKGDTTWIGVVDAYGNAVSMIQSHYFDWGAGVLPKGTGVLMQNRGAFFSLDANHVNKLEPRKRTFHTINPAMLVKDNKPYVVYGTQGGEVQPQTQAAVITRIVDFKMPIQSAIEAPRWNYARGGAWGGAATTTLTLESRWPQEVVDELVKRGHPAKLIEAGYTDFMGTAGAILIDPASKIKFGGADPRGDGAAVGY
jgi:gamma-glutamyltranspeptidase/glutathione hydrolase